MSREAVIDIGDGCPYQLTEYLPELNDLRFALMPLVKYGGTYRVRYDARGYALFVPIPSQYSQDHRPAAEHPTVIA